MPFKEGYKTKLYSLHQKGTSLSDEAVVPSQYDLNLKGRFNTNTTPTSKGSSYTCPYLNIFDSLLLFIVIAFFYFGTKGRTFCVQP